MTTITVGKPKRKTSRLTWSVTIVLGLILVMGGWGLFGLHVTEYPGPVSADVAAAFANIPIPPEARAIRVAGYEQLNMFDHYLRFEAPVNVCEREAAAVVTNERLKPVDQPAYFPNEFPTRSGVFTHFEWFDLPAATELVSAGGGPSKPQVWVDRKRGVFYFRISD